MPERFKSELKNLLNEYSDGKISIDEAVEKLSIIPFSEMTSAKYDWHRPLRNGFSEVVFGEGKTVNEINEIVTNVKQKDCNILVTRIDESCGTQLKNSFGEGDYHSRSRTFCLRKKSPKMYNGLSIVSGGTADMAVAEEARRTAWFFGAEPTTFYDVGIAGLPRLLSCLPALKKARVIIAVAGLEGALASVLGGLVDCPIIAVPTSVGYGTAENGKTALKAMLTSCAEGISVVNIDNGFGSACAALRILRKMDAVTPQNQ